MPQVSLPLTLEVKPASMLTTAIPPQDTMQLSSAGDIIWDFSCIHILSQLTSSELFN